MEVKHQYYTVMLGSAEVGKTSFLNRIATGTVFNRKTSCKPSLEDEPTMFSFEIETSIGCYILHIYDWAWTEKARDVSSLSPYLSKGKDGSVFMFSVTSKKSLSDFRDLYDIYERASGFDKPCLIISNKNDQKKKQVGDGEGQSLANKGNSRAYVAISLTDDSGVGDVFVALLRLLTKDLILTISSVRLVSEERLRQVNEAAEALLRESLPPVVIKTKVILLLSPNNNTSIADKFIETLGSTEYAIQIVSTIARIDEIVHTNNALKSIIAMAAVESSSASTSETKQVATVWDGNAESLSDVFPVVAILAPPSLPEALRTEASVCSSRHGLPFISTVPRTIIAAIATTIPK